MAAGADVLDYAVDDSDLGNVDQPMTFRDVMASVADLNERVGGLATASAEAISSVLDDWNDFKASCRTGEVKDVVRAANDDEKNQLKAEVDPLKRIFKQLDIMAA